MQIILRAAVLFFFLWVVTRALGRRELSELSTFELILMVVLGDLIQQGVTGNDFSVTGAMLAAGTFVGLVGVFSFVSYRFSKGQELLQGIPVVIVRDGKPIPNVLEYERLTLEDVKDAAREQGIADLGEIVLGVLEADGKFSFLKAKDGSAPQTEHRST
jgi:uncharacterized membrane protein YcaP (DUF421 family)